MQELLAVALGGSIGAVSRYLVTNYIFIRLALPLALGYFYCQCGRLPGNGIFNGADYRERFVDPLLAFIIVRWFSGRIDNIFFI